ncbi:MAG: hypothetical protein ACLPV8_19000 [Steroidobacteraceae bacterium]
MRVAVLAAVIFLSACASDTQSIAPPPGVDFSGQWKLDEADSDDPTHLTQAASGQAGAPGSTRSGGSGGQGGRGGGGGRGGAAPGLGNPGLIGPATPSMSALSAALRWPGKRLEIKQAGAVLTFTSDGQSRVCQPRSHEKKVRHRDDSSDRDTLPSERDAPPPRCGWSDKTLIVESSETDEDRPPFEEHYSLSADGQRLIEMVGFKGARYSGFTASRVWDRVP